MTITGATGNQGSAIRSYKITGCGQTIHFTPPQPLYSTLDGKIADEVDVVNGVYRYNLEKVIVTGKEIFQNDFQEQSGYYGSFFNYINGKGDVLQKVICNYLPYIQASWNKSQEGFCQNNRKELHLKFSNERLGIKDDTPLGEKRTAFANYLKKLYESEKTLYVIIGVKQKEIPIPQETLQQLRKLKTYTGVTNIICNAPISCEYEQSVNIVIKNIMSSIQKNIQNTEAVRNQMLYTTSLLPDETQATMIEKDQENLLGGLNNEQ